MHIANDWTPAHSEAQRPLVNLLSALSERGYDFVTPAPSTCWRMFDRPAPETPDLRDVFGWNFPFEEDEVDPEIMRLLRVADLLEGIGRLYRSRVRVSAVHRRLFLHTALAVETCAAVPLGPAAYRFADFVASELKYGVTVRTILDMGAGAGVGGIVAARYAPGASVMLADKNPHALMLAGANAAHAGVRVNLVQTSTLEDAPSDLDLVIADTPHLENEGPVSLDWLRQALPRLAMGGRVVLHTSSAILSGGVDRLHRLLQNIVRSGDFSLKYRELESDILGEELQRPAYADVERIAAIGAVITRL